MNRIYFIFFLISFSLHLRAQIISTVVGNGSPGGTGDGGPALSAALDGPTGVTVDAFGNIYISSRHCVRKVNTTGIINTIAGDVTGTSSGSSGNGGPATAALLNTPGGIVTDAAGNIYFVEFWNNWVRKINTAGIISTFAGTGAPGFSGDGGPAISATLKSPRDLAIDAMGNIYIADAANHRIRKVNTSGIISTVAGTGFPSFSGDGGPAVLAEINDPHGIAVDPSGNLYISDYNNVRVRKIDSSGIINTIVGNGSQGNSGDGGMGTSAQIGGPMGLKLDVAGNLYIVDYYYSTVRKLNFSGIINTVTGNGINAFSGDGGAASLAQLNGPRAICFDSTGNLYIADSYNYRIRKINFATKLNERSSEEEIKICPNPATDLLFISYEQGKEQNTEIEITDYLNQTVLKIPFQNQIDVTSLAPGFYFVKINSSERSYYSRLVRE